MGWTFFQNPVASYSKTQATAGAWEDWDLSGIVPSGTKAVAIISWNTDNNYVGIARKNGTTWGVTGGTILCSTSTSYDRLLCMVLPCDGSRIIETKSISVGTYYAVMGYTDSYTDFEHDYGAPSGTSYETVDMSSEAAVGDAAAVFMFRNSISVGYSAWARRDSDTSDTGLTGWQHPGDFQTLICGLDGSRNCQVVRGNTTNTHRYAIGSIPSSDIYILDDPVAVTPGTTGSYQTIDISSYVQAGHIPVGGIFQLVNENNLGDRNIDVQALNSTDELVTNLGADYEVDNSDSVQKYCKVESDGTCEGYVQDADCKIYLIGYFYEQAPPVEITTDLDAVIQKTLTKTLSLDSLLNKSDIPITLSIDAGLIYLGTLAADLDAVMAKTFTHGVNLDANVLGPMSKTTTLDAYLYQVFTGTLSVDAIIQAIFTGEVSLDALLNKMGIETSLSIDALIQKAGTASTSIDALLNKAGIIAQVSLDSLLSKTKHFTGALLDGIINKDDITISTVIDAYLKRIVLKALSLDALLTDETARAVRLDAYLKRSTTASAVLDSILKRIGTALASLDAYLAAAGATMTHVDALITKQDLTKAVALDGALYNGRIRETSIDSILWKTLGVQVNLDACIHGEVEKITLLDAILVSALLFASAKYSMVSRIKQGARMMTTFKRWADN